MKLLDDLAVATSDTLLYGAIWYCVLSVPYARGPGILYLLEHFPKDLSASGLIEKSFCSSSITFSPLVDENHPVLANEVWVDALKQALSDTDILVRRNALDLATKFPFDGDSLR